MDIMLDLDIAKVKRIFERQTIKKKLILKTINNCKYLSTFLEANAIRVQKPAADLHAR